MSSHSSPQFSFVDSYNFILSFTPQTQFKGRLNRRQNTAYIGQGQAVNSCNNAIVYTLVNGQLWANSSTSSLQFGMTPGTPYANFTASANPGNVTTTFSVDSSNNLMWNNIAFYDDFARFCAMPDNTIIAVFSSPEQAPIGCTFVNLDLVRLTNCVASPNYITGPSVCLLLKIHLDAAADLVTGTLRKYTMANCMAVILTRSRA